MTRPDREPAGDDSDRIRCTVHRREFGKREEFVLDDKIHVGQCRGCVEDTYRMPAPKARR